MGKAQSIKVLLLEDVEDDAALVRRILLKGMRVPVEVQSTDRLSSALECLAAESFDVVLSDLGLPDSQGLDTFSGLHSRYPDVPIIVLSGLSDEDLALRAVQGGAQDYLVKGYVDSRLLGRAIRYAIERQKLLTQLEKNLKEINALRGLIPICAWCKKIRDDSGYWKRVETYIRERTGASFTHGICPDCARKVDPDFSPE
ncbi:MAG: response regulator [Nitrospirae bacterium]|nr:response regulator [Nitrospirota bacterium]